MGIISEYDGTQNFLLITIDSCRWDTYLCADLPNLKSTQAFRRAESNATFTLPSHIAIFSGIFPHVREQIPFYNRFVCNLFRPIEKPNVKSYLYLPENSINVLQGLKALDYKIIGTGAVEWFKSPLLTTYFDEFYYSGIHAEKQVNWIIDVLRRTNKFFGFLNLGETHDPYLHGGFIAPSSQSRQRMREKVDKGFSDEWFEMQVRSLEFLDKKLGFLLNQIASFSSKTVVIICSDHGECFGEDGLYGHGFYHPKIMEVPLAIFEI